VNEPRTPSSKFDAYASSYEEMLRDPLRVTFTRSDQFFFVRKIQVIREFYNKMGVNTSDLDWLDAGCGQGDLLRVGHRYFKSATGCDPSEGMLQSCSEFEVKHQVTEDQLPFEDSSFDFITAVCVYHHVPGERRLPFTLELKRLLKPAGILCVIEHNPLNPITSLIVSRSPVDKDAHLLRLSQTREVLSAAGTKILATTYFLVFPAKLYRPFSPIERWLSTVPLGGQYATFAQRDAFS
jgi:SAM-dependent methyltransferase